MNKSIIALTTLLICLAAETGVAVEIDGFTEPSRDLDLAAADTGRIESIDVREGETIQAGQQLATLNQDILSASRRIVEKQIAAQGKLKSAKADLRLKTERVRKLSELLVRRHATQEEVDRADIEREIAAAAVEVVEEERAVHVLERERIDHQLERQIVRSPIDGVVVRTMKDAGEFVSPADPVVLRVVQLNPMLAVFNVPEQFVGGEVKEGAEVSLAIGSARRPAKAIVGFVSPVIEPQSSTVRVKVRIDNSQGEIRSGEKCALVLANTVDRIANSQE